MTNGQIIGYTYENVIQKLTKFSAKAFVSGKFHSLINVTFVPHWFT